MEIPGTLPLAIALILAAAITAFGIAGLRTTLRRRRNADSLPDPKSIERVQSGMLDRQRSALASDLVNEVSNLPAHEMEVTRHALWTAMLLEAGSDGRMDLREMRFIAELFGQITGVEMDQERVIEAAEHVRGNQESALGEISKAAHVSNESKVYILAGAFLVSVSDRALAAREADCLGDIADELEISQRERKTIYDAIGKQLGI